MPRLVLEIMETANVRLREGSNSWENTNESWMWGNFFMGEMEDNAETKATNMVLFN